MAKGVTKTEDIIVKDNGFTVVEAPDEARISLEVLASGSSRGIAVHGDRIVIGTFPNAVTYAVHGRWSSDRGNLRG